MTDIAPILVSRPSDWPQVLDGAGAAPALALDIEGNGLFVYRAQLCVIQLSWQAEGTRFIAIIDPLAVDPAPLAPLLGEGGPVKILHDLTFDARLLAEHGLTLTGVRDTSVTARMLGRKATGLASLLSSELGIDIAKGLQRHDWSKRPLGATEIAYLAADVQHLEALDAKMTEEARLLDIEDEIAEECAYKLDTAFAPPRDQRPAYQRIRGVERLDPAGVSVLRRLVEAREEIASARDVPPFKVADNAFLLEVAARKIARPAAMQALRGAPGARPGGGLFERLGEAVRQGLTEPEPTEKPTEGPRLSREEIALRRAREGRLTAWRRAEAKARGVDEQVVLPGHCLQELASAQSQDREAVAGVPGLGARRLMRYGETLVALMIGEAAQAPDVATGTLAIDAGSQDNS